MAYKSIIGYLPFYPKDTWGFNIGYMPKYPAMENPFINLIG